MRLSHFTNLLTEHLALIVMVLAVLGSAISVIYTKHQSRVEFVALQQLEQRRDHLDEEWGRLLLEQSTWASPGRVEREAKNKLSMIVPTADRVVVINR